MKTIARAQLAAILLCGFAAGRAPTITNLAVPQSTLTFGQPVTLDATVTSGGLPVSGGQLTFYDGEVPIGVSYINSDANDVASFTTALLPAGPHSLTALFPGNFQIYLPSTSGPVLRTLTSIPSAGLGNASIYAAGNSPVDIVQADFNGDGITDLAVANFASGTVSVFLGNPSRDGTFSSKGGVPTGTNPTGLAVADFNNDGIPDLVVTNSGNGTVSVLLGNGDGTFLSKPTVTVGSQPYSPVVGDFNRDGIPDIMVANFGDANGTISVLLGNGDGTFQTQLTSIVGRNPHSLVLADFNNDGITDVAVVNAFSPATISVWTGLGNGSFSSTSLASVTVNSSPYRIVAAKLVNSDVVDLVVSYNISSLITVIRSTAPGVFGSPTNYTVGLRPFSVAVGDIDGDGNLDIVAANQGGTPFLSVLRGNGAGNFTAASQFGISLGNGAGPAAVLVGDFNGDGRSDVALADVNLGNAIVALGLGPTQTSLVLSSGTNPSTFGDNLTFTANVAPVAATGTVTFFVDGAQPGTTVPLSAGQAQLSLSTIQAGTHAVTATYNGDAANAIGTSVPVSQTVKLVSTTILTATPNPSTVGASVTLTAIVNNGATGTVNFFRNGQTLLGPALLSGGIATFTSTGIPLGQTSLSATYQGDGNYQPSNSNVVTESVANGTTTTVTSSLNPSLPGQQVTLTATVTPLSGSLSNLTGGVIFVNGQGLLSDGQVSVVGGVATQTVTFNTTGPQLISATYGGDPNFAQSLGTLTQTVGHPTTTTLSVLPSPIVFGQEETLTATVTSASGPMTGSVTFYDGATVLGAGGLALVNGTATATMRTPLLSHGKRNLRARYSGDALFSSSFSTPPLQPVVGSLPQFGFNSAVTYAAGPGTVAVAVGDFNGDGIEDLAAVTSTATVKVLLGVGNGTFQSALVFSIGSPAAAIAAADVDGDGFQDLVMATASGIEVLLNTGGGVFSAESIVSAAPPGGSLVITDVNGDGIPDAITGASAFPVFLLGVGDGTFKPPQSFVPSANLANSGTIAVISADFNNDGTPDVAAIDSTGNLNILLGKSAGPFPGFIPPIPVPQALSIAIGDFNNDGNADIAVGTASHSVSVFLGKGDGTFFTAVIYPVTGLSGYVAAGDFTGDGILDLAVTDVGVSSFEVLPGTGSGAFGAALSYPLSRPAVAVAVGNFTGNGRGDLAFGYGAANDIGVVLGALPQSAVTLTSSANPSTFSQNITLTATVVPASATGTVTFKDGSATLGTGPLGGGTATLQISALTVGSHSLTAAYSGNNNTSASVSAAIQQLVNSNATTTTLASSPNPSGANQGVTLTAKVTSTLTVPVPTGSVQFLDGTTQLGTAALNSSGVATLAPFFAAGSHALKAIYGGDQIYAASTSATVTQSVYAALSISTSALPAGQVGQSYNATLSGAGGSGNYVWSAAGLPAGLTVSSSGSISGTPSAPSNGSVTVTVLDGTLRQSVSLTLTLTIAATPVVISGSGNLGDVAVGSSVAASYSASGGVPPYRWALTGGAGLTVDSSGNVRGSVSQPGSFSSTLTVTDSVNTTSSVSLSFTVLGISGNFPGGTTTSAYSGSATGVGGVPPYSYSASGVPQGLTFSGGTLTGQPKTPGTYSVAVQVTDSKGVSTSGSFSFAVTGAPPTILTIATVSLADGFEGKPYSQTLDAAGGAPGYTWTQSAGQMPAGLSLSNGTILGTPATTSVGTYTIGVQVADIAGAQVLGTVSINIRPAPLQITSSATLPSGLVGIDYPAQILTATGGTPPYTFSVTGALPAGITLANGQLGGTPATAGDFAFTLVVADSAPTPGTANLGVSGTIKPNAPDLVLSSAAASFSLTAGTTDAPSPATIQVSSSVNSQVLSFTTTSSLPWVTVGAAATTPGGITVGLNGAALNLSAGGSPYSGTITIACTSTVCAGKTQTIRVALIVTAAPPQLSLGSPLISFTALPSNPQPSSAALSIVNAGGGSLAIQSVSSGAPWISVGTFPTTVAPGAGGSVTITANPAGLNPGYYLSSVTVTSAAGSASVPVTFLISGASTMTLGPAGTQFSMPQGGALGNPNGSFLVSVSTGTVAYTTSVLPGADWLSGGGTGSASPASPGVVSFSIDQTAVGALAAGAYYGTIRVSGAGIVNSPQDFQVILNISPASTRVVPDPQPAGLVFISSGGTLPPQTVQLFASSKDAITYQASASALDSGWLTVSPATGITSAAAPANITVSANPAGLSPGVYRGTVSFAFATAVRTVNVTLIVKGSTGPATALISNGMPRGRIGPSATPLCAGAQLVPTQTGLVSNFSAPASWPTALAIKLVDTCGTAIGDAQIVTTFSNGDPPMILTATDSANGLYSGTWTPRRTSSQITILARASVPGYTPATVQIPGQVAPNKAPQLAPNGTYDVFHPQVGAGLGPGNIVQIYGSDLAAQIGTPTVLPLPSEVNGTSVLIGGVAAPLYFVSPGQINAQIPFELTAGNQYQVIVSANGALTTPQPIQLTSAVPAILEFATGAVVAQHPDGTLILDTSPAAPGEYVVIYLTGLGATDVLVPSGTASPTNPLANVVDTPVVTLNGTPIPILFAGLTPSLVGLYQINFQLPQTFTTGNYELVITQSGTVSNRTILQVQQ